MHHSKFYFMMRQFILLLTIILSNHAYGQYNYNEQRQREVNLHLESIKKGMEFSSVKTSEFKMNEQAVQEMVDRWRGTRQQAEKSREELIRDYQKKKAEENSALIGSLLRQREIREKVNEISTPVAMMFLDAGFQEFEAKALSLRSVKGVPASDEVVYQLDSAMLLAVNAHALYQEKEETAGFDELFALIMNFRIAGYSALSALEKLEKRFPGQKDLIDYAKPFAALAYWTNGEWMPMPHRNRSDNPRRYDYLHRDQMDGALKNWYRKDSLSVKTAIAQTRIATSWNESGASKDLINELLAIARSAEQERKVETATAGKIKVKKVKHDGNTYEGEVNEKNLPHGKGKLITNVSWFDKELKVSYQEGNFVNGIPHGKIFEQYNFGFNGWYTYDGYYEMGKREGWGKYVDPDEQGTYEGEWKQDLRHGKGRNTYPDGYVDEGFWFYDVFTGRKSKEE